LPRFRRAVWIISLFAFVTGCSEYRLAPVNSDTAAHVAGVPDNVVQPGSFVKVLLNSGQEVEGEVLEVHQSGLSIQQPRNRDYEEVVIEFSQIERIEMKHYSGSKTMTMLLAGAAVFTYVGIKSLGDVALD
jgi:hypothetical protein